MLNPTRLTTLILLGGVVACARNAAEPLKDGSWRVQCEDQVEKCVREAQRVCGDDEYHVISGKKEEKLYGGDTGYQTGVELHSLEFRCGSDPGVWKLQRGADPAAAEAAAPTPPPKQQKLCTPGSTQRCVGAGACEGGQSCNADGTAFLPCDCGAGGPAAPASDTPEPAPSAAPPPPSAPSSTTPPAVPLKSAPSATSPGPS